MSELLAGAVCSHKVTASSSGWEFCREQSVGGKGQMGSPRGCCFGGLPSPLPCLERDISPVRQLVVKSLRGSCHCARASQDKSPPPRVHVIPGKHLFTLKATEALKYKG